MFGYWTATPTNGTACEGCGAGFGVSRDGVTWRSLPSPGPSVKGEVGGVARVGSTRIAMVFDAGHLFFAPSPRGPFAASETNFAFLGQDLGARFPRLWGEDATGDANLTLVSHQQMTVPDCGDGGPSCPVYYGLLKRATVGGDGVLRATWYEANDKLKGDILRDPSNVSSADLSAGVWLEAEVRQLTVQVPQ